MNLDDIELPSNRKFGYFFSVVFGIVAIFFFAIDSLIWSFVFGVLAAFWTVVGMIISPIVLGLIFFALFTPIAIMMRLFGRDELRLKVREKRSH